MSLATLEANKALARRYIEAIDREDREAQAGLTSPEMAQQAQPGAERTPSPFGEHRIEITDLVAEGDQVWAQVATRGTHVGEYHGVPATGKSWTNRASSTCASPTAGSSSGRRCSMTSTSCARSGRPSQALPYRGNSAIGGGTRNGIARDQTHRPSRRSPQRHLAGA